VPRLGASRLRAGILRRMSAVQPWTADRELDLEGAAAAIHEAVPDLADAEIRLLGSGWDFDAYEADGCWVFRFPRREDGQTSLRKDLLLLPWIAEHSDLPIPHYAWGPLRAASFPYVFAGYRTLVGRSAATVEPTPALLATLGRRLGAILGQLHAQEPPRSLVEQAGLDEPLVDPGPLRDHMRRYLLAFCERVPDLAERATRFFDDADIVPSPYVGPPRLIHADLHAEHLLLEPAALTEISGLLDWSDARVSDPARDFACMYSWGGEAMLSAMVGGYGGDDGTLESRARFLGICFSFMDWTWWVEIGNEIAERAARRTLERALA